MSNDTGSFEPLKLPKSLDLRAAAPLLAQFEALRGRPVSVDASDVEQVGAQCVQILVSAQQTWLRDGLLMTLVEPSAEFADALRLMGISPEKIGA